MTGLFRPPNLSIDKIDDDNALTDGLLREILPHYNSNDQWDEINPFDPIDFGDSDFSKHAAVEQASTDPTMSPCPSFLAFDMDSYLTSPSTNLHSFVDTTTSDPVTPSESFSFSMLSPLQGGREMPLGNESKILAPPDEPSTRCRCLQVIQALLDDFESKAHLIDPAVLDCMLAWQKKALARCNLVLSCSTCVARSEYILLLGLIAERLATLCESTVSSYLKEVQRRCSHGSRLDAKLGSRTSSEEPNNVFLGRYEVESPEEWSSLMRVLIVLQLQSVRDLLIGMKKVASAGTNKTQLPMVQATERRVGSLIHKLRES